MAKKTDIRKDLIDQLERNGILGSYYVDLINDYMALWDIKNGLIKDIKKRGVTIEWKNGNSQSGWKKNESISELNKTNAQMLRLLNDIGLKATKTEPPGNNNEEM